MTGIERHWQEEAAAELDRKLRRFAELSMSPDLIEFDQLKLELYPHQQYMNARNIGMGGSMVGLMNSLVRGSLS